LSSQEERYDEQQIKLSAATTAALQLARQHQLTLTLFQEPGLSSSVATVVKTKWFMAVVFLVVQ